MLPWNWLQTVVNIELPNTFQSTQMKTKRRKAGNGGNYPVLSVLEVVATRHIPRRLAHRILISGTPCAIHQY